MRGYGRGRRKGKRMATKISELEAGLKIDEHKLDVALIYQPELYYAVAKELTLTISRRDEAKQNLEKVEAVFDQGAREAARKKEEKITEKQIDSLKATDDDVIEAFNELSALNKQVGQLSALKEAFTQRGYVLKSLCELHAQNYFSADSMRSTDSKLKNSQAQQYAEARRERKGK